jgi:hypothetical protein
MPSTSAVVVADPAYVYVETSWGDVPAATNVCMDRVVVATGERTPLRPYVSYDTDGCLALSCGTGIFWDTEAPFDTPVQYCATATNAAGSTITTSAVNLVTDTFTRVTANGWGTPDIGPAYVVTGGIAANYSTTGARGQHAVTDTGVRRSSSLVVSTPNFVAQATAYPVAIALTQSTEQWLLLRADAAGLNGYKARLRYGTAGTVDLILESITAGVPTVLAGTVALGAYIATTGITVKFSVWGSQLSVKAWDSTTPEPAAYLITVTDTTFTAPGTVDLVSIRNIGNTNGTINFQWDNLTIVDVCADLVTVEACSASVTLVSDGCFRLGDPVRPCSDRHVCLEEESDCSTEDTGIYFGSMTPGTYADNSGQLLPVNARRPIVVSRERRDAQAELVLVTRTFDDRDDLLELCEPGTPLLWRGPASYGTGDPYMSVADVTLTASFADLQEEPRVASLPHWVVDSPPGPSLGVCGTRVMDLCDVYPTWTALTAAGLTYGDLLRGRAGTGTAVAVATWNDVNADFATWNALNAAEPTWDAALTGFP